MSAAPRAAELCDAAQEATRTAELYAAAQAATRAAEVEFDRAIASREQAKLIGIPDDQRGALKFADDLAVHLARKAFHAAEEAEDEPRVDAELAAEHHAHVARMAAIDAETDRRIAEREAAEAARAAAMPPPETGHGKVIASDGQIQLFKGCAYVQDINQIMTADGIELKREPFENDDRFKGRSYVMDQAGKAPTDSAWECFTQSKMISFPTVSGSRFDPTAPPSSVLIRDGLKFINTWRPVDILCKPGDVSLYTDHIKKLFPKGDDALIYTSFVAACVQNLGIKASWALFVQGVPGNGKSFLTKVLTYCLGECYVHTPNASTLDRQFNGWMYRKLLICVEEVMVTEGKSSTWEKLKTMITETRQEIEGKNANQVTREVCCNYIFNSNHKDGLRKTKEDRRICPLYTAQQSPEDLARDGMRDSMESDQSAYFDRLWSWFNRGGAANILHYLRTFPIPAKYNFALEHGGARVAPRTTSTEEALEAGLGAVEQDIKAAIAEGKPGFKGGWISYGALDVLLTGMNKGRIISRNKRGEMLATLGYVRHPGLGESGQVPSKFTDGSRPVLYVLRGHSTIDTLTGAAVADAYLRAQSA